MGGWAHITTPGGGCIRAVECSMETGGRRNDAWWEEGRANCGGKEGW